MIFYYLFFIGFFGGVIGGELGVVVWFLALGLGVLLWNWKWGVVFFVAVLLGCGRILMAGVDFDDDGVLGFYNGKGDVEVRGIVDDVDERREFTVLIVEAEEVDGKEVSGRLRFKTKRFPQFEYGDELVVVGELERPESFDGFNFEGYLARYGVYSVMSFPRLRKVGEGRGNWIYGGLVGVRSFFEGRLNGLMPEPYSSFMAGLLMGSRKGIPQRVLDDFQRTGLTHIIAISGYNITLLIVFVSGFLGFLEKKLQVGISMVLIVAFTFFVGASAAVVRAAIMGILGLGAIWVGRKQFVGLAVGWSAFLMVAWNPYILVYDIGFQLSFLAVLSLIYVMPLCEGWFRWVPEWGGVREAMGSTVAAQVLVLPVIVFYFGQVSVVSPVANVLVLPFLPMAMASGALMLVVDLVLGWAGLIGVVVVGILKVISIVCLRLVLVMVEVCAGFKFAAVDAVGVSVWILGGYYLVVIWFLWRKREVYQIS